MLQKIVLHLEQLLGHSTVGDYPGAHNGLQIENSGRVARVCAASGIVAIEVMSPARPRSSSRA